MANRRPSTNGTRDHAGFFVPQEGPPTEIAVLVGVHLVASRPGVEPVFSDLDELERLADTAGAQVRGRMEQRRTAPDVRSLIGKGKAEQLKRMVGSVGANVVIFDNDLTPAQGRNLEKMLGVKVIDRTEIILDIFARHARTQQARLQVGLAQYEYLLPRLARMWKHLERQAGGIGTRGPGETQIETDRRIIRRRITQLQRELRAIDRRMETQHKRREGHFRVALVGYTNAGKSSLMNRITRAGVYVQDQLFATLDATTRRVDTEDGHQFLLTDTVGFIRKLPHHLVESFRATLSEVNDADLLFHVIDVGDEDWEGHVEAVQDVLATVTGGESEAVMVFNKVDAVDPEHVDRLRQEHPDAFFTSAYTGEGVDELLEEVDRRLRREERRLVVRVDHHYPRSLARLHEWSDVTGVHHENGFAEVTLRVNRRNYGRVVQLDGLEVVEVTGRG